MQENENRNMYKNTMPKEETRKSSQETKFLTNLTNNKTPTSLCNAHHRYKTIDPLSNSPVLTEILKSNEILPYVLHYECFKENDGSSCKLSTEEKFDEANSYLISKERPSFNYTDYIEVSPEHTKQMERMAPDNSLFLAIARSLLYKVHFVDKRYQAHLRRFCLDGDERRNLTFDSDLGLQELLRKKLCLYWLSFVSDGKFKQENCKYSKDFPNVLDFIYQVYRIGINNFSNNNLFSMYALEDLASMIKMKICLFEIKSYENTNSENNSNGGTSNENNNLKKFKLKIFEPCTTGNSVNFSVKINDHIFLSSSNNSKLKYKFLLPKSHQQLLSETLLSTKITNNFFLRTRLAYSNYMVLLSISDIKNCFSNQELSSNINLNLFLKFLSESSVHTLVSIKELKFSLATNPIQMVTFLNEIWGQNHFLIEEILAEMDENNNVMKSKNIPEKDTDNTEYNTFAPIRLNQGSSYLDKNTQSANNQIKRFRKASISTNPSSNLYEILKSSQNNSGSNQISKALSNKISKMEIKSHENAINHEPAITKRMRSDSEISSAEKDFSSFNRKRSHSDNISLLPSNLDVLNQQKVPSKFQEYFLPPTLPKAKRTAMITASDLKYNPVLPSKLSSFSSNNKIISNNCPPPLKITSEKMSDDCSNFKSDEANIQHAKSRTRTRTLTQLNTRQSIGSCLSNLLSLNIKEPNGNVSINSENSDSSLFYRT